MRRYVFLAGVLLGALVLSGCVGGSGGKKGVNDPDCCCFSQNASKSR